MSKRNVLALAWMLAAPLAAQAQAPQKLTLTLNFLAGGPQAGFMYAQGLGLYKAAGIDLAIQEGKGSATTTQMLATGQTDVGFADAPSAMQLAAQGAPVEIIAPILQTNGFAIISLASTQITTPKDLIGRRLAVQPGTAQTTLLVPILAAAGIKESQLQVINLDPSALVGSLLQKRVDALLGGADYHTIQIEAQGVKASEMLYRDIGVPTVGLSIIARTGDVTARADLLRRFVAVSLDGWDRARKDPHAAAAAVHAQFPSVDEDAIYKQLVVDLKLLCAPGATALGRVPQANWQRTWELLTDYLNLPKTKPIGDYYTDALLPAQPPACGG